MCMGIESKKIIDCMLGLSNPSVIQDRQDVWDAFKWLFYQGEDLRFVTGNLQVGYFNTVPMTWEPTPRLVAGTL